MVKRNFKLQRSWPRVARRAVTLVRSRRRAFGKDTQHGRARSSRTYGLEQGMSNASPRFDADTLIGPLATSLQSLYDAIPVALGVIDRDGRYTGVNGAYAAIHGLLPADLTGRRVNDYLSGADEQLQQDFADFDAGFDLKERELACHGRHFMVALQAVRDSDGNVLGMTTALVDITNRKRMEVASEEARRLWQFHASHDHLTGLANRRRLDDALAAEARRCMRSGAALSVLMMDVDYFKSYNDHAGHQKGDECLRAIAARLRKSIRRHSDLVGRYGGEEFIAILPDTDTSGAQVVARHILQDIRALAIWHPGSPYDCVTISIGVTSLDDLPPSKLGPREALLHCADRALYAAKAAGRNTLCVYPPRS
ncbi:diguanylate cyclase with PAS/PAC sensor [Dyella jiangningensis]|nr:PAS domain S-box-containing protein/diguanylate cyclase (GGDEF)-like protein [Dyella sp. AtDHG13]SDK42775.1 diguanylate cyclase with PAS/PAC sensor [Dyella jiangningensis]